MICSLCHDVGWVLEAKFKPTGGLLLELIPCPIPDCHRSGQRVELISVDMLKMCQASFHPKEHFIMSISKGAEKIG